MKKTTALILVLSLAAAAMAEEFLVQFDFDDGTKNPSSTAGNISSTAIGAWSAQFRDDPFVRDNQDCWQVRKASAGDNVATFVLTIAAGCTLEITDFSYQLNGDNAGYTGFTVAYSTDGSSFTDIGSDPDVPEANNWHDHTITPGSAITGLEGDVTIRMTATCDAGYKYFEHDNVAVIGNVILPSKATTIIIQ